MNGEISRLLWNGYVINNDSFDIVYLDMCACISVCVKNLVDDSNSCDLADN